MSTPRWRVERARGSAAHVLGQPLPDGRSMRIVSITAPAVVLGSTQALDVVDASRAATAGVDVVKRRGGGGAVFVGPGELVWADVFVRASDSLWSADVSVAFHWLGAAWTAALADLGVDAKWHDGALCTTTWSRLVCFSGMGPGEVSVDGRKVVGICQRRTRAGSLFMCAALLRWDPAALVDLLALTEQDRVRATAELTPVAQGLDVTEDALVAAFQSRLEAS